MPRKNGKSALGSGLALDGLLCDGHGADVYSCAGDFKQAGIVFTETKRMIQAEPELLEFCKLMRDVIEVPSTNSIYRVLSAEAYSKEGLNPSRTIFDEVHVQPNDELWEVMNLARAGRLDPLLLGITTAGVMTNNLGQPSLCYRLWQHGRDIANGVVEDDSFYMAWWGAPEGADHRDPEVWELANPGYGDLVDPEDFAATIKGTTTENQFRTKRLNQWVGSSEAWLPAGAWENCKAQSKPAITEVILGFDGSYNGDSTALVGCTPEGYIFVIECWEKPEGADDWKVNVLEVEEAVRAACRKYRVREIVCDRFRWQRSMEIWESERLPVVEFPQNATRMTPATTRFYEAVMNGLITHDGDTRLARHLGNCVLKVDSRGQRLAKESKGSQRRIDLAVAAVMAYERACQGPEIPPHAWSLDEVVARLRAERANESGTSPSPKAPTKRPDGSTFHPF